MRVGTGRFREPDAVYLSRENLHKRGKQFWTGADLVVEVAGGSPDDQVRDRVTKRSEYAEAGIRENWLADPDAETFTVLTLTDGGYVDHGVFRRGETVASPGFPGLSVDVSAVLDAD